MALGINFGSVGTWFASTGSSLGKIFLIFFIVGIVGVGSFAFYLNRVKKRQYIATINLFKVVNGKKFWIGSDKAKEVVVPGTNVRLLYWKSKKLWSAYPTRSIGFNVYAYMLNRMGELTNFDLGEGIDETEAKIDYDHRDQTYAYLNLQEFISRNYKNRNQATWWKEHIGLISTILILILFGLLMWYFFSQSGKQLTIWAQIANDNRESSKIIADALLQSKNLGSGIVEGGTVIG